MRPEVRLQRYVLPLFTNPLSPDEEGHRAVVERTVGENSSPSLLVNLVPSGLELRHVLVLQLVLQRERGLRLFLGHHRRLVGRRSSWRFWRLVLNRRLKVRLLVFHMVIVMRSAHWWTHVRCARLARPPDFAEVAGGRRVERGLHGHVDGRLHVLSSRRWSGRHRVRPSPG